MISDYIAYWKLDEATGDAIDSSGNGYTGTSTGTTSVVGKIDSARNFVSGSSEFISIAGNLQPSLISISLWATNSLAAGTFISKDAGSSGDNTLRSYSLEISPSGFRPQFSVYDNSGSSSAQINAGTSIGDGLWHHIVGTWDGTTVKIYLDTVLKSSTAFSGTVSQSSTTLEIGRSQNLTIGRRYYTGSMDDIRIYDRALTADDISQLYLAANKIRFFGSRSAVETLN